MCKLTRIFMLIIIIKEKSEIRESWHQYTAQVYSALLFVEMLINQIIYLFIY